MLKDYFNTDVVSKMSFSDFEQTYKGSQVLVRLKIDIKDAFKELGGKIEKSTKTKKYKNNSND